MYFLKTISEWIQENTGLSPDLQQRILVTIVIIFLVWVARKIIVSILSRRIKSPLIFRRWRKTLTYIFLVIAVFSIGRVWFAWFQSITTYLGFLSAGLAVAAKDIILDLAGWLYISIKKPFNIGDRISVESNHGDVIEKQIFQFVMMEIDSNYNQRTGKIVYVPNSVVFLKPIINFSSIVNYIWKELIVQLTYNSNIALAVKILKEVTIKNSEHLSKSIIENMKKKSRHYTLSYASLSPNVYISGNDNGVILNVRFLCLPDKCRDIEHNIWQDIIKRFDKAKDIDFAYTTSRVLSKDITDN